MTSDLIIDPHGAYSFVAPKIAIGGVSAYGEDLKQFGFLMNVAFEFADQATRGEELLTNGQRVVHARLDDSEEPHILERMLPEIHRAVGLVKAASAKGEAVLVTCAAGRNRSGLVLAEFLIQRGVEKGVPAKRAKEVIKNIQARRANALTNALFVKWLLRRR